MADKKRYSTGEKGVYYRKSKHPVTGKLERVYYIRYRKDRKQVEEKIGRESEKGVTLKRAVMIRALRNDGQQPTNEEQRKAKQAAIAAERGKYTLDKLWSAYKDTRTDNSSLQNDDNRYANYLQPLFGNKTPDEIHTWDVVGLRTRLLKKLKPQTTKHILALLARAINFGVKNGLCPRPDESQLTIEYPKVDNKKTEDLTKAQLKKLLEAIEADKNRQVANLMKLALFTGMRRGELFKLKWRHINFDRSFIQIVDPKGGKAQEIPLNDTARAVLEGHERTDSEYVFPGRNGQQRKNIHHQTSRIKNRAKLPKGFRALHGLRHVFASMMASSGEVDMYTLQKMLTHKSPAMTQRYAHLRDEALQRASSVADVLFTDILEEKSDAWVVNINSIEK